MQITLDKIGKRFNKEWIFRNISYTFSRNDKVAILGTNGSGKSTLLQIIAGSISQSEGEINPKTEENYFKNISYAAPYLELPEEMTWREAVSFHGKFKKFHPVLKEEDVIAVSGLGASAGKELRNFSSGMKQRARLALAILSDTPLLLLDEPVTNLDAEGIKWYRQLIADFAQERLVIVCSNYNKEEYGFCSKELIIGSRS